MFRLFVFLLTAVTHGFSEETKELVFTHVIYRHGARSPSRAYPNDLHQKDAWPQGWQQLTQNGMMQEYKLGQFLRNRYIENTQFLSSTYKNNETYVRSSNKNRALESAASCLAGLYPPEDSQKWNPKIQWQPIAIHCDRESAEDLLMKPTSVDCPNYEEAYEKRIKTVVEPYNQKYQNFFDFFKRKTGLTKTVDIEAVGKYGYGPISCEIAQNLTQPDWVYEASNDTHFPTVWSLIKEMKRVTRIAKFDTPEFAKFIGGFLLNDILERMVDKTNSSSSTEPGKMMMYSTHQGTVMGLMYAMGVQDNLLLPFASCLIIELLKTTSTQEYIVEVYLRNLTDQTVPHKLKLPACHDQGLF